MVDDDENVCRLSQQMLVRRGYEVLTAATGEAAECLVRREQGRLDVALVDRCLEEEDDLDVLRRLQEIDPAMLDVWHQRQQEIESLGAGIVSTPPGSRPAGNAGFG